MFDKITVSEKFYIQEFRQFWFKVDFVKLIDKLSKSCNSVIMVYCVLHSLLQIALKFIAFENFFGVKSMKDMFLFFFGNWLH